MAKFSTNSKSDVIIHIAIIIALLLVLFFSFFFIYLPWSTNHGESITVPELKGMTMEDVPALKEKVRANMERLLLEYRSKNLP